MAASCHQDHRVKSKRRRRTPPVLKINTDIRILDQTPCTLVLTATNGALYELIFERPYGDWGVTKPLDLLSVKVITQISQVRLLCSCASHTQASHLLTGTVCKQPPLSGIISLQSCLFFLPGCKCKGPLPVSHKELFIILRHLKTVKCTYWPLSAWVSQLLLTNSCCRLHRKEAGRPGHCRFTHASVRARLCASTMMTGARKLLDRKVAVHLMLWAFPNRPNGREALCMPNAYCRAVVDPASFCCSSQGWGMQRTAIAADPMHH